MPHLDCERCDPRVRLVVEDVDEGSGVLRCPSCASGTTFARRPLLLVTGSSGAGKTTLLPHLSPLLPGTAVFDTDVFGVHAQEEWADWASAWVVVAHSLAQTGLSAVMVGYGLSLSRLDPLPVRPLVGEIRALHLHVDDDVVRQRLTTRPAWRGFTHERIERKIRNAHALAAEADEVVDVTGLAPPVVADRIAAWVRRTAVSERRI